MSNTLRRLPVFVALLWCTASVAQAAAGARSPLLDRATQLYVLSFAVAAPVLAAFHLWKMRSLLRQQNDLERQVAEAGRAAREAQHKAEEATAAKTKFLSSMSHQIRTPMSGIIGMTDMLTRSRLNPEQREYADTIGISSRILLGIIDDILDLARAQDGNMKLDCAPFDLRRTVEEAIGMAAPAADHKRIELVMRYPSGVPQGFAGDANRIRQLVLNLVDNAIKFTRHGYVLAEVMAEPKAGDSWMVKVAVEDTGAGINAADCQRLFREFERVDIKQPGAGLGLAICRRLVELMGGSIGVESHPAGGSRFWFAVPLKTVRAAERDAPPVLNETGARVLLAAPKSLGRKMLSENLAGFGMQVHCVEASEDVLTALQQADTAGLPFTLILLDLAGLGMHGPELAVDLRRDPRFAKTPMVVITSSSSRGEGERSARLANAACVSKPVRLSELEDAIAAALSGSPPAVVSPSPPAATEQTDSARWTWDVLLVEDNAVNQRVALAQLRSLGCRVDIASTGVEAVERVRACTYDVVFMDCLMPELDGFEATRRIRELERGRRHTTIVAMTARAYAEDRQRCRDSGMDDYLAKPVLAEDMRRVLERWKPARLAVREPAEVTRQEFSDL